MFDIFKTVLICDEKPSHAKTISSTSIFADEKLRELLTKYGGKSFNQGLYRIISADEITAWNDLVLSAFPSFSGRITCFAIDWLGRIFAVDSARLEEVRPGVVLFEPGTGEALEIPCNIESFHESELIHYREEALAESFFKQWLANGGKPPCVTKCIGYKKPLFLGGSDTIDNLEMSDLDVYWTISAQLIAKTKGLPSSTLIGNVTIG